MNPGASSGQRRSKLGKGRAGFSRSRSPRGHRASDPQGDPGGDEDQMQSDLPPPGAEVARVSARTGVSGTSSRVPFIMAWGGSQGHWLPQQKRGPGGGKVCDAVPMTPVARPRGMDRARQHQLPPSHPSQSQLKANPGGHVPFS